MSATTISESAAGIPKVLKDAIEELRAAQLGGQQAFDVFHDEDRRFVISQDPQGGTSQKKGSTIVLTVGQAPTTTTSSTTTTTTGP